MRLKRLGGLALLVAAMAAPVALTRGGPVTAHAAAAPQTYYFHGSPADNVNRAQVLAGTGGPSATFDTTAPTSTSPIGTTQTGTPPANQDDAGNALGIYWYAPFSGTLTGSIDFDWWWSSRNAVAVGLGAPMTVTVFADPTLARTGQTEVAQADITLNVGPTPTENKNSITLSSKCPCPVAKNLLVQVTTTAVDAGHDNTVHYDSTAVQSSFTATIGAAPPPTPTPTPTPTSGGSTCITLCFSAPVVLPKSSQAANSSFTDSCYSACGEPSLAVSPVDGTLYVSTPRTIVVCCNTQSSPVWKSADDGKTWSDPIFPSAPESATTGGDTELAVDKRGTVYEGELWLGSDSIYVSPDKGNTWNFSPASHDVGSDREWFVYSPQEDALYGWYDGFKGLMVVKAPLTTPLGSSAAQFFPQERLAVPECVAGAAVNCPPLPADSVAGTPVVDGTTSPGRPSISPVDGTLYFPFPYQVSGKGIGIATTTDGQNFTYNYVKGAGGGSLGDTGNDFPVSAVDAAGRLYVAWIENKGDGYNLYLASSGDKGATWTAPVEVSKGISATAVFPNVVAGAAGQVAVSWYGTSATGDPNSSTDMAKASWNVYATQVLAADTAGPSLTTGTVQSNFHTGVICTMGTGCSGDGRKLLDFFDMKLDRNGNLGVIYTRDAIDSTHTEIVYASQTSGCVLSGSCAPAANVPEFSAQAVAPFVGTGVVGLILMVRRRRRKPAAA